MAAFDRVLSGYPSMDQVLDYIRLGDNVVIQVTGMDGISVKGCAYYVVVCNEPVLGVVDRILQTFAVLFRDLGEFLFAFRLDVVCRKVAVQEHLVRPPRYDGRIRTPRCSGKLTTDGIDVEFRKGRGSTEGVLSYRLAGGWHVEGIPEG